MDHPAFLSVRIPIATRNRVKALAAARGQTVQELVGGLVEQFLAEQDREPHAPQTVFTCPPEAELENRGVVGF